LNHCDETRDKPKIAIGPRGAGFAEHDSYRTRRHAVAMQRAADGGACRSIDLSLQR
jgi:hypothetical protein